MEENKDRITLIHVTDDIVKTLNFEKGLLLTIRELLLRPGKFIREYLETAAIRKKYMAPVQYSVLIVGIYTFLMAYVPLDVFEAFQPKNLEVDNGEGKEIGQQFTQLYFKYFNLVMLSFIPLTSVSTYLWYRKAKLYYAEHLVINAYVVGSYTFLSIIALPAFFFNASFMILSSIPAFIYPIWVYIDIFNERSIKGSIKGTMVTASPYVFLFVLAFLGGLIYAILTIKK